MTPNTTPGVAPGTLTQPTMCRGSSIAAMLEEQNPHMPKGVLVTTFGLHEKGTDLSGLQSGDVLDRWMDNPATRKRRAIAFGIGAFCFAYIIGAGVVGAIASYQLEGLL